MAGKKTAAHPGFQNVEAGIARREGIPEARAAAELASSSRNASAKAKRANPRLKRVKGAVKDTDKDGM
ncbi:MAG TPA: hypothetical protein VLE97_01955 [Gaiellaceae bacterium]|nr:hypothetical protein [Gaiellaceae bacterium]